MNEPIRVALAGLFEEVNTFAAETMGLARITGNMTTGFQRWSGQALVDGHRGTRTYMGGFLDALAQAPQVEVVPSVLYSYGAGPPIEGAAYAQMKGEIVAALLEAMPLDAVLLQLHGAAVAEGVDDVEGDLCAAIREALGPTVRLVCAADHHANLTQRHLQQVDLLTMVHHYPHVDMYDAAHRAARLVPAMVRGETRPHGHLEPIPLLLSPQSTIDGCLYAPIRAEAQAYALREGIHEFSFAYGFPFADVDFNHAAVNCWAESPELAASTAKAFAAWVWANRERFVARTLSAQEAVALACDELARQGRVDRADATRAPTGAEEGASAGPAPARSFGFVPDTRPQGPVVIADKSDNTGSGAPGDATHLLRELIARGVRQAAVCTIRDPETVRQAMGAGVGSVIDVELGGKASALGGAPIRGKGYVKSISDGRYTVVSPMGRGTRLDTGPSVGLLIEGVDVAVISGTMQPFDAGQMKQLGFDPRDYRVVVLKSANHFRAWWSDVASLIIDADPQGIATSDLWSFEFKHKRHRLYPLDAEAAYDPALPRGTVHS